MTELLIWGVKAASAIGLGVFAGCGIVYVFNKVPASWFCDYGEEPDETLKNPYRQRIKGYPWRWVFCAFFVAINLRLVFFDWMFAAAALVACWALLMIALADGKYGIIPDQFVILTAISAFGFLTGHPSVLNLLAGVALGGGVMLLLALLGKLIFKQEALGFGDVKLFAAVGLVLGFWGTLVVLILACLTSSVVFATGLIRKKIKAKDMKPFGPYICGAAIFYIVIIRPLFGEFYRLFLVF